MYNSLRKHSFDFQVLKLATHVPESYGQQESIFQMPESSGHRREDLRLHKYSFDPQMNHLFAYHTPGQPRHDSMYEQHPEMRYIPRQ